MDFEISQLKHLISLSHPELLHALQQDGKIMHFSPGECIINFGQSIKIIPIILKGSIKVIRQDEDGKEIFLYFLNPGETCAMSLTCCSTYQVSQIKAIAEEETTLIAVPIAMHEDWMNNYREWKEFVARTYAIRFQDLLQTIDNIAFKNMDERLIKYLHAKFEHHKTNFLIITHQEIATELNTSREVVSRLMKQLEKNGSIKLGRNKVTLIDNK